MTLYPGLQFCLLGVESIEPLPYGNLLSIQLHQHMISHFNIDKTTTGHFHAGRDTDNSKYVCTGQKKWIPVFSPYII